MIICYLGKLFNAIDVEVIDKCRNQFFFNSFFYICAI